MEVPRICTGLELFHMEANTPLPHLRTMGMWNSRSKEIFQFQGAHHLSVYGASQIVLPLHPQGHLLVFQCERKRFQVQSPHLGYQLLFLIIFWDGLKPINIIFTGRNMKSGLMGNLITILDREILKHYTRAIKPCVVSERKCTQVSVIESLESHYLRNSCLPFAHFCSLAYLPLTTFLFLKPS